MKTAEVEEIYQEVRAEFRFPPTKIEFRKGACPAISNACIELDPNSFSDGIEAKSVIRHEVGHMHFAPVTMQRHATLMKDAKKILENDDNSLATETLNVAYDMIVDTRLVDDMKDDMKHRITNQAKKISPNSNYFFNILAGYYNSLVGEDLIKVSEQHLKDLGEECLKISREKVPMEDKSRQIINLIKSEASEQHDNDLEELKKGLEMIKKMINSGMATISVQESNLSDEEVIEKMAEIDADDGTLAGLAQAMGVKLSPFEMLRIKAKKNIRFRVKVLGGHGGKLQKGAMLGWNMDDETEELEAEESIRNGGVLIPEMTTVKFERKEGRDEIEAGMPKTAIIIDTSGSMDRDDTCVALFSFIEACRYYKVPVSTVMFSNDAYFSSALTTEYMRLEREVYKKYSSGGTTLYSGIERYLKHHRPGTLIIYISDFESYGNDLDLTEAALRYLSKDNPVVAITMFSNHKVNGVKNIRVENEKAMQNMLVDLINAYMT